jgi:hypothetical protein
VMGDAEPFGELPWRQTGALAQLAQVCLPSWVPHRKG